MIYVEIKKLIKIKVFLIPLIMVIVCTIYMMAQYGEFGQNLSSVMTSVSEKDGEILLGQEGYERNKTIAKSYTGIVNDEYLERIHKDCVKSTYFEQEDGEKFYNSTYRYFQKVFFIDKDDYLSYDTLFGDVNGRIKYGFTGDWDAYLNITNRFFLLFLLFIIIFAAPLFSYEKECRMMENLAVAYNGGKSLFKHKVKTVFLSVNSLMLLFIGVISLIHFSQYGFDNYDISIQCSTQYKYINSCLDCNMAEMSILQLIASIIGCNIVLTITVLISMLSSSMLGSFVIGCTVIFPFYYSIINLIVDSHMVNRILSVFPVNSISINTIVGDAFSWKEIAVSISVYIFEFMIILWGANRVWRTRIFFVK